MNNYILRTRQRLRRMAMVGVVAAFCLSGFAQHQQVTLTGKNLSLKKAFAQIEKQTKLSVDYKVQDLNDNKIVKKVPAGNSLKNVMDELLSGSGCIATYQSGHIIITKAPTTIKNDHKTISGKVVGSDGTPLTGATVHEVGTQNATITDLDGYFTLTATAGASVEVSYLGMKTEYLKVGTRSRYNIVLADDQKLLNEVVVVGFGTQKKANLTGAVASLSGDKLENRAVSNIAQALQGEIANLNISNTTYGGQPGSQPSFNLRGYTGIDSGGGTISSSPLIVIDGIQGGDLSEINMNDVESINVLKDAASAAIYGSSAPYGVIIVSTKKGAKDRKPSISYSNNMMFSQAINLPKYANSRDFANLYNTAAENAGVAQIFSDAVLERIDNYLNGTLKYETVAREDADNWGQWYRGNANNDWFDILFKDMTFSHQHNAGIQGGSKKVNYYVGLGYLDQAGMYNFVEDSYKRYNVRANLNSEVNKWLSFSVRTAYSRGETETPYPYEGGTYGNTGGWMKVIAARNWPTEPLYAPNGSFADENRMYGFVDGGKWKLSNDKYTMTGEFTVHPLKDWNIIGNFTLDNSFHKEIKHRKTVNVVMPSGAVIEKYGPSAVEKYNTRNSHQTINLTTDYEKQIADHYFKVLAGYTQELYHYENIYGYNNYLYSNDIPSLHLSYGDGMMASDTERELAIRGWFGRINYNYKEKYLVELNGRYDGTSRFMAGHRFKFYPGMSAAWVLSKESFWKPITPYVNVFKVRASYGKLGDQGFTSNYYPFYPSMGITSATQSKWLFAGATQEGYVSYPSLINNALTWVTTSTIDVGFDIAALNNRLNVTFDWYTRKAEDFVGPAQTYPAVLGTSAPQTNNVSMRTNGFELTVGWKDKIGEVSYGVSAVLSDYQSTVLSYPNEVGLNTTWYKGGKLGDVWGYQTVGYFKDMQDVIDSPSQSKIYSSWQAGDIKYADLNGDGKIDWGDNTLENPGDKKIIANTTPRFQFGINMNAEWRGIDASIFLQGVAKRDAVFSNTTGDAFTGAYFWGLTGDKYTSLITTEHLDYWTEDNTNAYWPRPYMDRSMQQKNTQIQSKYVQNAAYLRIKNIQIGYSLPKQILQRFGCEKMRFFVNCENLATFTSLLKTMDPEFAGTDGRVYPLTRTFSFGLNVTF